MKDLAYLNKFLLKYKWKLIPGVFFVITSNFFAVIPAQIIRLALDMVTENIALYRLFNGFERQEIIYKIFAFGLLFFGALVLLMALVRGILLFFMRQTIILTSRHIEYDLKNEIYEHYQKLNLAFFRRNNTGNLMNHVTEDVSRVRMYLGPAIMYTINTVVLFLLVITSMLMVNVKLALLSIAPLPILALIIYNVHNKIHNKSEKIQERLSSLSSFVQESFSGIRVIKAYTQEQRIREGFANESEHYKEDSMSLVKIQALFYPIMLLLVGISTIITVYIGGLDVISGKITAGNIAEFIVYVNQLTFPVSSLGWVTSLIQRAAASQKRINVFLHTKPEIVSLTTETHTLSGRVEFKNVDFIYPDTGIHALKNVSFSINPGEKLAIIGRTGSGKSTLANILLRMYDVSNGEVLIDGKNIKLLNLNDFRSQTGFVPQDVFLFSDTIAHNIAFGQDTVNMNDVEQAAKNAAVYNNIMEFENQFETFIGERGITLSGGQKQRVSIARAIINSPKLLIFDDSLSAVDTKTEESILRNLGKIMQGKTSIIIAHRVSTIKNSDKILVLDDGKIIEQGKHEELIENRGLYFELYEKQLLEEEVL
ncbi:ABC transporter related protein [Pseudopedobacter saltans DSM 12145]|uniref:ABC transporter related protein n=1 Tax=Pseudopedobacter saltans (strain ATCC 51119 / DSM 12145 / JCM 21818 / CCUG 39354 / LMG 10337 / NBRC 100064 / NCIMB 13643) TaxID=762903 RepID=F0SAL8_PSESL|nr:ABC transporter ATP-binding protein [Pseudopedobacter saltans]ADY52638.1 ABC transporter related protein [Pseudopedobacter saltans DSM 12145]